MLPCRVRRMRAAEYKFEASKLLDQSDHGMPCPNDLLDRILQ